MALASWLSALRQPRRRPIRKATHRTTRLSIEMLEDRVVPTTPAGFYYSVTSLADNAGILMTGGHAGTLADPYQDTTLRGAIVAANADLGADTILFNIAGGGKITLASMLPILSDPNGICIDGANGTQGAITIDGGSTSNTTGD